MGTLITMRDQAQYRENNPDVRGYYSLIYNWSLIPSKYHAILKTWYQYKTDVMDWTGQTEKFRDINFITKLFNSLPDIVSIKSDPVTRATYKAVLSLSTSQQRQDFFQKFKDHYVCSFILNYYLYAKEYGYTPGQEKQQARAGAYYNLFDWLNKWNEVKRQELEDKKNGGFFGDILSVLDTVIDFIPGVNQLFDIGMNVLDLSSTAIENLSEADDEKINFSIPIPIYDLGVTDFNDIPLQQQINEPLIVPSMPDGNGFNAAGFFNGANMQTFILVGIGAFMLSQLLGKK